jgi:TonB family protein
MRFPRPTLPVSLALLAACSTAPRTFQERVEAVLEDHRDSFGSCYALETQKRAKLAKVETEFTIDPQGRVSQAAVRKATLHDAAMEKCVLDTIRSIQFPKGQTTQVSYPFTFHVSE